MELLDWYRLFTWLCLAAVGALSFLWLLRIGAMVSARLLNVWQSVRRLLNANGIALATLVAGVATAGSLYLSEGGHLIPCRLCWYQRSMMYPLAIILIVALIRHEVSIRPYAITLALLGSAIALWHYLVEWFPSLEGVGGKCDIANPCSVRPLPLRFGFISIPFMALTAFALVATILWFGYPSRSVSE